jgi:hypothetical protein
MDLANFPGTGLLCPTIGCANVFNPAASAKRKNIREIDSSTLFGRDKEDASQARTMAF